MAKCFVLFTILIKFVVSDRMFVKTGCSATNCDGASFESISVSECILRCTSNSSCVGVRFVNRNGDMLENCIQQTCEANMCPIKRAEIYYRDIVCPRDFTKVGTKCYKLILDLNNKPSAVANCKKLDNGAAKLAEPTKNEYDLYIKSWIQQQPVGDTYVLINYEDLYDDKSVVTSTGQKLMDFELDWKTGEPNDALERCVTIFKSSGELNDYHCTNHNTTSLCQTDVPHSFSDPCCADLLRTRRLWRWDFIRMKRVLHLMRAKMKRDPYLRDSVEALTRRFSRGLEPDRRPPPWVRGILARDSFLRTDVPQAYYSQYNGGLVTHVPGEDAGLLVHVQHEDALLQKHICLDHVSVRDGRLQLGARTSLTRADYPVYEINSAALRGTGYVAVRTDGRCSVLRVERSDVTTGADDVTVGDVICEDMWKVDNGEAKATAVTVSPYIPGEIVSCWDNGQVLITNEHDCEVVVRDRCPRFAVSGRPWLRAHYGPTPRTLLLTDHTAMDVIDLRTGRPSEQELFAIPSRYCLNNELLMTSHSHPVNPFYHLVATDYKMFLLDQRMTRFPVLQMQPSLRQAPQYMQVLPSAQDGVDHVILANQSARETLVYELAGMTSVEAPPTQVDAPWRVGQIEDCVYQTDRKMSGALSRRFLEASLLGICALRIEDGMSVIQMSSAGDLFHQDYFPVKCPDQDKTSASGLNRKSLPADDPVRGELETWFGQLENTEESVLANVPLHERFDVADASDLYSAISSNFRPHDRCPMCRDLPGDEAGRRGNTSGDEVAEEEKFIECLHCGLTLFEAARLKHRIEEGVLYEREQCASLVSELEKTLDPPDPSLYQDPQSRILTKLWNHDYNIHDEIEERFTKLEIQRRKVYGEDYTSEPPVTAADEHESPQGTPHKRPKTDAASEPSTSHDAMAGYDVTLVHDDVIEAGNVEDSIADCVDRLLRYEESGESGVADDFDETELEMFQMSHLLGSFSFMPDIKTEDD